MPDHPDDQKDDQRGGDRKVQEVTSWSTARRLAYIAGGFALAGAVIIILYGLAVSTVRLESISVGLLTAMAALATGILFGFLFGIPRYVSSGALRLEKSEEPVAAAKTAAEQATADAAAKAAEAKAAVDKAEAAKATRDSADAAKNAAQAAVQTPGAAGVTAEVQAAATAASAAAAAAEAQYASQTAAAAAAQTAAEAATKTMDERVADAKTATDKAAAEAANRATGASNFEPSTNLAEVSDWLTKLLLGAGLVQLTHLGPPVASLVNTVASGLSGSASSASGAPQVMAGTIMVTYLGLGFLAGYVMTTLWYGRNLAKEKRLPELLVQSPRC
jgi:hypothetical protein